MSINLKAPRGAVALLSFHEVDTNAAGRVLVAVADHQPSSIAPHAPMGGDVGRQLRWTFTTERKQQKRGPSSGRRSALEVGALKELTLKSRKPDEPLVISVCSSLPLKIRVLDIGGGGARPRVGSRLREVMCRPP